MISSQVTDRERQLAERHYLKHFASDWVGTEASEASKNLFCDQHPRYTHLVEGVVQASVVNSTALLIEVFSATVHGLPEEALQGQKSTASALKDGLICILTIRCFGVAIAGMVYMFRGYMSMYTLPDL